MKVNIEKKIHMNKQYMDILLYYFVHVGTL